MTDFELLQRYLRDGAEDAFATLVRRHVDLVYSAARRQVSVPHLAEDITQAVFIELARHAPRWRVTQPMGAWLYVVTRRTAIDAMRRETRRIARELASVTDPTMTSPDAFWNDLRPLLDEAMASLGERERIAIVGRFFENKNFRDVARDLGASEDAAQKRVIRALEQLRTFLARRGLTVTAGALATTLSAQAVQPAPAAFAAQLASNSAGFSSALAGSAAAKIPLAKIAAAFGLAGASAAAVLLAVVLAHQQAELVETRTRFAAANMQLDALRRDRDASTNRTGPSGASALATSDPDAVLRAEIRAWTGRIEHLKKIFQQRPDLALPEMALLTDEDWREVTSERSFDGDESVGRAISDLRNHARAALGFKMIEALSLYLKAHGDILPPNVADLAPYFQPPVDPAILARYEMLHQGPVAAVPALDTAEERFASYSGNYSTVGMAKPRCGAVIAERAELLILDDDRLKVGPQSYAVVDDLQATLSPSEATMEEALDAYRRAHAGTMPARPTDVLPYFDPPLDPAAQQKIVGLLEKMDRQRAANPFHDLKP
jgi:RNA polymerase sigma factor (sigma-70 family)